MVIASWMIYMLLRMTAEGVVIALDKERSFH